MRAPGSPARRLNLERSLKIGDELGGHIVTGHIDGVAKILSVEAVRRHVAFCLCRAPRDSRVSSPKKALSRSTARR